jgi:serine/threonine protein kinase
MAWPSQPCIGEQTLAAFADGQLVENEQRPLEGHLADCADCRAVLARAAGGGNTRVEPSAAFSDGEFSDAKSEASRLAPGVLVGRYVIEGLVGRGAMGAVYGARDPDLDRKVAVKILRADALSDNARRKMRARLLREAQAMACLSHPEVITVYDVGAFEDQLFVAMEYVEGETLRQWRGARHRGYAEILAVYERAGSGLAAAHDAGLVHRDFKPDNVLVGRDGRVRVTDFGLARAVRPEDADDSRLPEATDDSAARSVMLTLTRTGALLGTPAYMAPEQLSGDAADARSDVFGFCVSLYEALYGERPFAGSTVLVLRAAIEEGAVRTAPVMTPVPGWIRRVLLRGLRAAPEKRFASMRAVLDALRSSHAASRRHRRRMAGIAAATIGMAAAASIYGRSSDSRETSLVAHPSPLPSSTPLEAAVAVPSPAVDAPPVRPPIAVEASASVSPAGSVRRQPAGPAKVAVVLAGSPATTSTSAPRSQGTPTAVEARSAPFVGNNGALILE